MGGVGLVYYVIYCLEPKYLQTTVAIAKGPLRYSKASRSITGQFRNLAMDVGTLVKLRCSGEIGPIHLSAEIQNAESCHIASGTPLVTVLMDGRL
jgi:hypothetical protein